MMSIFVCELKRQGYRNVYSPFAELYHHESVSRGPDTDPIKAKRFEREAIYMKKNGSSFIENDPAYNSNLSLMEGYKIDLEPWTKMAVELRWQMTRKQS